MVFCSLIASSAIRAFISALKDRRCLDFISAPFPRQRFYTLLSGPNLGEHFSQVPGLVTPQNCRAEPSRPARENSEVVTQDSKSSDLPSLPLGIGHRSLHLPPP